jgi:hypothetical protein
MLKYIVLSLITHAAIYSFAAPIEPTYIKKVDIQKLTTRQAILSLASGDPVYRCTEVTLDSHGRIKNIRK